MHPVKSLSVRIIFSTLLVLSGCNPLGKNSSNPADFHPGIAIPTYAITALVANQVTACALVNGSVQCWGKPRFGELGTGTPIDSFSPVKLPTLSSGVTQLMGGIQRNCAIKGASIYCWGRNIFGELGNATVNNYAFSPVQVTGITVGNGGTITSGHYFGGYLENGVLQMWGSNSAGQLGDGTRTNRSAPVTSNTISISSSAQGQNHTCAIVSGAVKCWGWNNKGQLGNGTTTTSNSAVQVSGLNTGATVIGAGTTSSYAVVNGQLYCWGDNSSGQLGDGTTIQSTTPVAVTELSTGVTAVTGASNYACALVNGGIQCWGNNSSGQLGDGTTTSHLTPAAVSGLTEGVSLLATGENFACAAKGQDVWCWGYAPHDSSFSRSLTPIRVGAWAE